MKLQWSTIDELIDKVWRITFILFCGIILGSLTIALTIHGIQAMPIPAFTATIIFLYYKKYTKD